MACCQELCEELSDLSQSYTIDLNDKESGVPINESLASNKGALLSISAKGSMKWAGCFEDLKCLVNDLFRLLNGHRLVANGDCKLYDSRDIAIRWYSTKGTLTLKGEKTEEVKSKLAQIIQREKAANMSQDGDKNLHPSLHNLTVLTEPTINEASEINVLKQTMNEFIETMAAKS